MNEKINITKMDGATVTADIIAFIENTATGKRYVYSTLNEIVGAGPSSTVKIYVSKLKQDDPTLDAPITDDDWHMLKDIMSDSIKGTVTSTIKYLPLSELGTAVSVSDRAIAMPTSYDYINKQRGLYAQGIATSPAPAVEPTPTPAETPMPTPEVPSQPVEPTPAPAPTAVPETEPVVPTVEPAPAVAQPEPPAPAPTPVAVPEPAQVAPSVPEPAPAAAAPEVAPIPEPQPATASSALEPTDTSSEDTTSETGATANLEPIDLATIEAKYAEMIEEINKMKEKELEAVKRYNATLELNNMHTEQHANYVQNDIKENAHNVTAAPVPEPTPAPTAVTPGIPSIEPTPVTPVVPAPEVAPAATPADIETNWFDMPNN